MDDCPHFSPVRVFFPLIWHQHISSGNWVSAKCLCMFSLSLSRFLPHLLPPIIIAWPLCLPHDEFLMSCCYFFPIILMDSNSSSTVKSESHPLFAFIKVTPARPFWKWCPIESISVSISRHLVIHCVVIWPYWFGLSPLNDVRLGHFLPSVFPSDDCRCELILGQRLQANPP